MLVGISVVAMQLTNAFFGGKASYGLKTASPSAESRTAPRQLTTCMAKKKGEHLCCLYETACCICRRAKYENKLVERRTSQNDEDISFNLQEFVALSLWNALRLEQKEQHHRDT